MSSTANLAEQVQSLHWAHTIDLGSGLTTPGIWPPSPLILRALNDIDFSQKKVLDIGCWDGLWSFEAERRGAAEVYATDDVTQRPFREQPTFQLAHRILNSRVRYYPELSVYDVAELGVRDFDIVLFCGVYYHLKDPLLALSRLRQVMREDAILVVEGEALVGTDLPLARFFYRDRHCGDPSNWWVPTVACLREWVECSCFAVERDYSPQASWIRPGAWRNRARVLARRLLGTRIERLTPQRYCLAARAVARPDNGYIYRDPELDRYLQSESA
jgi:tRNA (mo5U34)-methyltransferase